MGLFTMPRLGADMERGTLLEWRVAVGDTVEKGDIVASIDTEKSTVDIEVFESGTVVELLVEPGTEVEVGTPLARLALDGDDQPADDAVTPATKAPTGTAPVEKPPPSARLTSPLVRRRAEQLHVDPATITGTGVDHRVTRDDVERAARAPEPPLRVPASPKARRRAAELGTDLSAVRGSGPGGAVRERDLTTPPGRTTRDEHADPTSSMRRAIARQMSQSNREIPHYHLTSTIDLHDALEWLAGHNAGRQARNRVLPAALFISAAARAMSEVPALNGSWIDDAFVPADGVNAAMAVSLRDGGLVAPVVHGADRLDLDQLMETLHDVVGRARHGNLRGSDLTGAGFTVTDLGERGADAVLGVIHPPQVALIGFGGIVERPVAVNHMLAARPTVTVTLSADHRATDGHVGSRYLAALGRTLTRPETLEER